MSQTVPQPVIPYRFNGIYCATIVVIHLLGLLALNSYFFSYVGLGALLIGIHVFGQGITIGYHRMLTHRSFKAPQWVERSLAILGICCMQDTPARWVATHRLHHAHSDEIPDPHSPRVSFWWSHMGWLLYLNRQTSGVTGLEKFAKDLLRDPFYLRFELNPLCSSIS